MINIVKQKDFKRKRRKFFIKGNIPVRIPFKMIIRSIFIFALIFSFVYFVIYIFRVTLFKSEYYIYNLRYSQDSLNLFDNPTLYKIIKDQTRGENQYVLRYFKKNDILSALQKKFPFVKDIEFHYFPKNTLDVKVVFDNIDLRFLLGNKVFALYKGDTVLLQSGNALGRNTKTVEMPSYLSGLDNLNGLFFNYSYQDFILNVDIILQVFGEDAHLFYIPGAKRIAIFLNKNKIVYVNLQKDIKLQMTQYDFLKKYDSDFDKYVEIDLGSLEGSMVIVKK